MTDLSEHSAPADSAAMPVAVDTAVDQAGPPVMHFVPIDGERLEHLATERRGPLRWAAALVLTVQAGKSRASRAAVPAPVDTAPVDGGPAATEAATVESPAAPADPAAAPPDPAPAPVTPSATSPAGDAHPTTGARAGVARIEPPADAGRSTSRAQRGPEAAEAARAARTARRAKASSARAGNASPRPLHGRRSSRAPSPSPPPAARPVDPAWTTDDEASWEAWEATATTGDTDRRLESLGDDLDRPLPAPLRLAQRLGGRRRHTAGGPSSATESSTDDG